MYIGLIILGVFIILTVAGVFRKFFHRWQIHEGTALAVMLLIAGGVLIAPVNIDNTVIFSIGGFAIPFIACIALLARAASFEVGRAIVGALVIGLVSAALLYYFPIDTQVAFLDSSIFIGLIAGGLAFLIGRSRRGALTSAILGVLIANALIALYNFALGLPFAPIILGTEAQFGAAMIAGAAAAIVAEVAGASLEYQNTTHAHEGYSYN